VFTHPAARGPRPTMRGMSARGPAAAHPARAMNPHAMFLAAAHAPAARVAPRHVLSEPSLDGLRDEVVPRGEAAFSQRGRDTWKTFFAAHAPAAVAAARRATMTAAQAQQLLTVKEHAAAVEAGHANATSSGTLTPKCLDGVNGSLCGDETVPAPSTSTAIRSM
jgi:hypothetical protein